MSEVLPLRLGILASGDPEDIRTWSGVPYFMTQALRKRFRDVVYLPAGSLKFSSAGMRIDRWSRRLFGRGYVPGQGRRFLTARAAEVDRLIEEQEIDVVLAITVDQLVAFLKTDVSLVHHSDTTYAAMEGYYEDYTSVWNFCRKRGNEYAARTLARADVCIYPSRWAADSAIHDYATDPAKVHVVPYGANMDSTPAADAAHRSDGQPPTCRLLFIGGQWERKGGEIVYAAMLELIERGIDTRLVVVGCDPGVTHENLEVISFLNKQVPADLERYLGLWQESDFLFMPSQHETFGAIFAEAAAHAVPVISRGTGGIPDAVEHGVSGYLLPDEASASDYADAIENTWKDREAYLSLRRGARQRFEKVLNWDAWAQRTVELVEPLIADRSS